MLPLPLNNLPMPMPATAHRPSTGRAARTRANSSRPTARDTQVDFTIARNDIAMIFMSPDLYFDAFEQPMDLRKFDLNKHVTAGLNL